MAPGIRHEQVVGFGTAFVQVECCEDKYVKYCFGMCATRAFGIRRGVCDVNGRSCIKMEEHVSHTWQYFFALCCSYVAENFNISSFKYRVAACCAPGWLMPTGVAHIGTKIEHVPSIELVGRSSGGRDSLSSAGAVPGHTQ
jgi:hypothetical protein